MTINEIIVIIGGLFFGFVMVNALLASKEAIESKNKSSNSTDKKIDNEDSANKTYKEKSVKKEDYIVTSWYKILGVSESASIAEISTQYKIKIKECHPDKVASLAKEIRDLAESKTKEINSAYEFAKRIKANN